MLGRGVLILTVLSSCASSLPVTSSQLENEDVKVMKCIVEALADVLSRPHSVPVSQQCLVTLKTDDRLVAILRRHNFLRELQEIAVQGNQERAAGSPDPTTQTSEAPDAAADRSMLEALGGAGERSILSQKRRMGRLDEEEDKDQATSDGASQEDNDGAEDAKRGNDELPGRRVSEAEERSESKAEKGESEEKRADSAEDDVTKDKKGAGSEEKIGEAQNQSKEKKSHEDEEEEEEEEEEETTDKRAALSSHKQKKDEREDEREVKGESEKSLKQWSKRGERAQLKKRARAKGAPHHSKEVTDEEQAEEEKKKRDSQRSPEEKELRMIARRAPEDRRVSEEEGSASRKPEEPEIESLAAIESELENVAQKLHELRRG